MTKMKLQSRLAWWWVVSVALSLLGYGHAGASSSSIGCGGQNPPVTHAAYEQRVVELVNAQRASEGLSPLKLNVELSNAARFHAVDMYEDDYFKHDTYDKVDGALVLTCQWFERIRSYLPTGATGENIAWGYPSPEAVVEGWMASPGHRQNILGDYWEIGVGYYETVWVQDFARHSQRFPLLINMDAAVTTSRQVTLYLYGDWDEMRLRNDGGEWSAWQPFQREPTWQLSGNPGLRRVEAEVRKGASTYVSSDEIELQLNESPTPTPTATPTPVPTSAPACKNTCLEIKVNLEGRSNPPSNSWVIPISVQLFPQPANPGQSPVLEVETTTNAYGVATLSDLTPGSYQMLIRGAHTLQQRVALNLAAGQNNIQIGPLLEGDIQVNNKVDIFDFSRLGYLYAQCVGDTDFDPQADLNQDGCINQADLQLLQTNFGAQGAADLSLSAAAMNNDPTLVVTNRAQGEAFSLLLEVDETVVDPVNAAALHLDFDPTLLRVAQVITHRQFTTQLLRDINQQLGQINFATGVLGEGVVGPFPLVEVRFEVLKPFEQTELRLVRNESRNTELATGGDSLLMRVPGGLETLFRLSEQQMPDSISLYLPLVQK